MAFNIVKHRRGTTEEWFTINPVPEDGELVIEECASGRRKCKIGNGRTSYRYLPYINDELETKLLAAIDELGADIDSKLNTLNETLNSQIDLVKQELETSFDSSVKDAITALENRDKEIEDKLSGEISAASKKLATDIDTRTKALESKLTDEISTLENDVKDDIKAASIAVNSSVEDKIAQVKLEVNELATELAEGFKADISEESSKTNKQIEELAQDIIDVKNSVAEEIAPALEGVNKRITDEINIVSEDLAKKVDDTTADADSKLTQLREDFEDDVDTLNETIDKMKTDLSVSNETSVAEAKQSLQKAIDDNTKTLSDKIDNGLADAETALTSTAAIWLDNLSKLQEELKLADKTLSAAIEEVVTTNEATATDVKTQLQTLHEKVAKITSDGTALQTTLQELTNTSEEKHDELSGSILALAERHTESYTSLLAELARLEGTQSSADVFMTDAAMMQVANIYTEIADLVDDDITILRRLFNTDAKLTDKIDKVDARLSAELSDAAAQITTSAKVLDGALSTVEVIQEALGELSGNFSSNKLAVDERISTINATLTLRVNNQQKAIDELNRKLLEKEQELVNRIVDVNTTVSINRGEANKKADDLNKRVDATNARIDTFNNKLAVQDKRISSLIAMPEGSTKLDAEVIAIREGYNNIKYDTAAQAVQAIGFELDEFRTELKASLPEYVTKYAVDGLIYEDNQLWLASNEQPVGNPVTITGGGGGGGSASTVKVTNNLDSATFTTAKGNPATIAFTYTSFENEVATGDGTFIVRINDKKIEELSGKVFHGVRKDIDVADYLRNGSNTVKVTCTDQYGTSRSLVYTISVIELRLSSEFDSTVIFKDYITFRYKVFGQIKKTAHIFIDGKEVFTKEFPASVHNKDDTLTIDKLPHGRHTIKAYMTASMDDGELRSNTLEYEILCVDDKSREAMLASVFTQTTATQGDLLSIPYQVYDPMNLKTTVELIVSSQVGGVVEEISRTTAEVGRELSYWNIRNYPAGKIIFTISYTYNYYGETKVVDKPHTVHVEELDLGIEAETDSLQLYLSSAGRSNTDAGKTSWTFNSSNPKEPLVTTTFTDFNWVSNGWLEDSAKDACLRLNGDARAVINFKPFATDFKEYGKTLEFEFSVRDVNNRDAVVIDCFDGSIGFRATPDTAFMQSSGSRVVCRYKDEERVRVSITVEPSGSGSQFVAIYLDGVLSGIQRYTAKDDIFKQTNPLTITLGSNLCGVDVYSVRVYNKALTADQVLTNYIADKADVTTKQQLVTDNNILFDEDDAPDESFIGKISYDKLKKLGQIPIITFTGAMPTYKGDKKKYSVYVTFEDPAHPELNFEKVLLKEIDVQGTSSAGYVRKNWKLKFDNKIQHMPGAIPAKVYCIKVDYAEATGTHNTGTANFVETLYDRKSTKDADGNILEYLGEGWLPPHKDDPRSRTTIQGFPCVIFEKTSEDAEPVFSSKGNFNYDKGAEAVFGFTEDYDSFGVECWEFCNNISDSVSFIGPVPDDWSDDFEPRYVPESACFGEIEDLIEKRKNAAKGDGVFTQAEQDALSDYQASCIANFKEMHDWVLSTALYTVKDGERTYIVPENDTAAEALGEDGDQYRLAAPVTYEQTTYKYDSQEYRLAKFKNEFEDHFNMHYATMYYVFTFFALMVDQRAKNMFLTRWKDEDGVHRWYPYFYDNDTIFGINNVGALVFDYYHEDVDQINSSDVYNGQNSVLWHNFRMCFASEIKNLYASLRSDKLLDYDKLINQYVTEGSDKWSANIYNADAEYKYVSMARPAEDGTYDAGNLKQVRGPGEHHLRYFLANRLDYCDSKWQAGNYPSDFITIRIYTPKLTEITDSMTDEQKATAMQNNARITESLSVVPASPNITVVPYSNMYAGVDYASTKIDAKRLAKGESYTFSPGESVNTNDAETYVYGASMLSSLGDLSGLYCDFLKLEKATKLVTLKIGDASPQYHNDNIKGLSLGANRLLKTLDIRNCSGLGRAGGDAVQKTLDISLCQNIEEIYAEGTHLTSISLPSGGYIKTLHLPDSTNNLTIQNQKHIEDFTLGTYENIKILRIEDCPTLDTKEMLESCKRADGSYAVEYVYLKGFSWEFDDPTFIQSLFPRYDEDGNLVGGVLGLNSNGGSTNDPAFLDGNCYIKELTGEEYAEIKSYFPHLKISFGKMTSNVTFKYTDANGTKHEKVVAVYGENSALGECAVPTFISQPAWPQNAAFTYALQGWSEEEQICKGLDDVDDLAALKKAFPDAFNGTSLKGIAGNRTLYPVFLPVRRSYAVQFVNGTDYNKVLFTDNVLYGSDAEYEGPEPLKKDAADTSVYKFDGWYPDTLNITGPRTCYAQFDVNEDKWYVIKAPDVSEYEDYYGNIYVGHELYPDDRTMAITKCINKYNKAVKVPTEISFDSGAYTVKKLGGFDFHSSLELISIPNTVKELLPRAFESCYSLFEITIPESVETIGRATFQGCSRIKKIYIPANVKVIAETAFGDCSNLETIEVDENNTHYYFDEDCSCLIDLDSRAVVRGTSAGKVPLDGSISKLGEHCFSRMKITTMILPDYLKIIPAYAFSNCKGLTSINIPTDCTTLEATCFAWCESLESIELPEKLEEIKTYALAGCKFTSIEVPAKVNSVLERAFGHMSTLKTIVFKKRIDADGNVVVPEIHKDAFCESGGNEGLTIHVPWSEDYDYNYYENVYNADGTYETVKIDPTGWGASNYTIVYESPACGEGVKYV